ncbi:MAG TPA: Yip1 family protein [Candidatus Polarisedimenticolia bacterium]|nr:Yip1 family protein [Candidatus Polarisedimenticolia bacterium]
MNDVPPPTDAPPPWPPAAVSEPASESAASIPPPSPVQPPPVPAAEPLNPWLSIWTRPRATMRQILDTNPRAWVHRLAILGGIGEFIGTHLPDGPPMPPLSPAEMLATKCVLGIVGGLIGLYVGSFIVWMTGRWIGGQGTFVQVRAASAWPNVLTVWGALLWLPLIAYLGLEGVNVNPESFFDDSVGMMLFAPVLALGLVLVVWRIIVFLKCLGEAHRFSAWHALGATLIGVVLLVIPFAILVGVGLGLAGLSALSGS